MTLFEAPAESRPALRVRLLIAYDGRGFHGFALQRGVDTVAGAVAGALERALGHPVEITCAGRTDTGVHAWGQVIHFDTTTPVTDLDLEKLQRSVNSLCGPAVVVRAAEIAAEGFDARRSARARRYRYTVLNRPIADPFLAATTWHVPDPLDRRVLDLTCDPVIGEHDFTSFTAVDPERGLESEEPANVRIIFSSEWKREADELIYSVRGSGFLHHMVRNLVGTFILVGKGTLKLGAIPEILEARDRSAAGATVPGSGLCLVSVEY